jgi:CBS domain-containing protein
MTNTGVDVLAWVRAADDDELLEEYAGRLANAARRALDGVGHATADTGAPTGTAAGTTAGTAGLTGVGPAAGTDASAGARSASRVISTLNDALTQRLLTLAESELGPPPRPYAWLALGSEGRLEQALQSDQDNALVYADAAATADATAGADADADATAEAAATPDAAATADAAADADNAARTYFGALAERVVAGLRRAGFPDCPGGYMATTWHRPMSAWQATFRDWLDRPSSPGVVEAEVFLDFRRIHGDLGLDPLDAIMRSGADRPRFLILMARAAVTFQPPLRFGRIRTREVDLKRGGIAPIVLLARLYALAGGSLARHTVDRLTAAAQTGQLSRQGAAQLTEAYQVFTDLRLRRQLRAAAVGQRPTNMVSLDELTRPQRARLTEAFHVVREHQQATELHFHTELVT